MSASPRWPATAEPSSPPRDGSPDGRSITGTRTPIISAQGVSIEYRVSRGQRLRAVHKVTLAVTQGETLGIVGESGSGKSSLARGLLCLVPLAEGKVEIDGRSFSGIPERERRQLRSRAQMIFQDSAGSLHPNRSVGSLLAEPLKVHRRSEGHYRAVVEQLLTSVGLGPEYAYAHPTELSGGQRQRVNIARALAVAPDVIVADEPTSSLDVSIQAQILNLLLDLQAERQLAYVFITHDLAVVQHMSHRVAVMYGGVVMEVGPADAVTTEPRHPYTRSLASAALAASRDPAADLAPASSDNPTAVEGPTQAALLACRFAQCCPFTAPRCWTETPRLREVETDHFVACHLSEELPRAGYYVETNQR